MAFSPASGQPHQSPQSSLPPLSQKIVNTGTWGANSNACLITDANIRPNSDVHVWVTGAVPAVGNWAIAIAQGTATVTSTDAESSTLPIAYVVY